MKAGPSTLAEVLVVGTDAFQEAKTALSHLPGQGVASQARSRSATYAMTLYSHNPLATLRHTRCTIAGAALIWRLAFVHDAASDDLTAPTVMLSRLKLPCSECHVRDGNANYEPACRMGRRWRASRRLWRRWRRERTCESEDRRASCLLVLVMSCARALAAMPVHHHPT